MRSSLFCIAICAVLATSAVYAADLTGTLKGIIVDRATQQPLSGANIVVLDAQAGSIAGADGRFVVPGVSAGVHRLQVSMIGYQTAIRPDIVVRANRITAVEVELEEQALGMEETVVTADYFSQVEEEAVSTVNFNYEEIRRSPGSAGDISRLLQALPAVNMASDQRNDLIVRGGSPAENLVIIDHIEIPNINHFPTQGASGGPIGLLNTDLIADVDFSAGGFSAAYGDRLSSAMVIDLREGNRDELDIQANLDMAGAGFIFEGPLAAGRGAWPASSATAASTTATCSRSSAGTAPRTAGNSAAAGATPEDGRTPPSIQSSRLGWAPASCSAGASTPSAIPPTTASTCASMNAASTHASTWSPTSPC